MACAGVKFSMAKGWYGQGRLQGKRIPEMGYWKRLFGGMGLMVGSLRFELIH